MSEKAESGEVPIKADDVKAAAGTSSWSSWFEDTKKKTIELAEKAKVAAEEATKVAKEKAMELAKQADEMRQKYDMEVAGSIIASLGGPMDTSVSSKSAAQKPKTSVLDLVYVTENLVAMAFPVDSKKPGSVEGGNDINAVSTFLRHKHGQRFMIWNVSEESYDYRKFDDQVLEYKFPGHPAPPLGLLFNICTSIESWLDADDANIAVIHCLTGKGRTAALAACVLTWIGEFISPMEALQYVAERRGIPAEFLTIPSQRRYVQYFSNMLDGVKPRSEPLLLRRVIINAIPSFGDNAGGEGNRGCCPYIQLFKCGKLVATAAPPKDVEGDDENGNSNRLQLKWVKESEGSVSFSIDAAIQGDILLRCRHADSSGARVSMFRAAFHTGYVPCGVLRLTKAQLDGACSDPRFDDEFFIDLIFAPIEKAANVDLLAPGSGAAGAVGVPSDSGLLIDASDKYESSLHKDAKFWEAVSQRKLKAKRRRSRKFMKPATQEQFSISDEPLTSRSLDEHTDIIKFSLSSAASPPANGLSGMSDMELIMQLARAEEDHLVDLDGGDGDMKLPSTLTSSGKGEAPVVAAAPAASTTASTTVTAPPPAPTPAAGDVLETAAAAAVTDSVAVADSPALPVPPPPTTEEPSIAAPVAAPSDDAIFADLSAALTSTPAPVPAQAEAPVAAPAPAPAPAPSASIDLLSLDDLEKELGIDLSAPASASASASSAAQPTAEAPKKAAAPVVDDDLDELERYLSKFSTPST